MSAAQWIALGFCVVVCAGALAGMWHELRLDGERRIRDSFRGANVAYDDAEVARLLAEEEAAWAEWDAILRAVDGTPHDEPTPIFTRTVLDDIYRRTGGGAA